AGRQLLDAAPALEDGQLADGQTLGRGAPRLRHDVQGLSRAGDQAHSSVRRPPSIHPRAGELERGPSRGSANREYSAAAERVALWALAHMAGDGRPDYGPFPAEVRH